MKSLTIGYEAKRAVANNTGLGNYSRLVVDVMSELYPDNRYELFAPKVRFNARLQPLLERSNVALRGPRSGHWRKASGLWRVWRGLTSDIDSCGCQLFHGLSGELPLDIERSGAARVVTIHDLIFLRRPGDYATPDRAIYDFKARRACQSAHRIMAISERTAADIEHFYGIERSKIDVVYQGCDPMFSTPVSEALCREVREYYRLPERYIISVGTVERRKNQLQSVMALRGLPSDVKLVLVGGTHSHYAKEVMAAVGRHGLTERVMWLQGVPFAHLPALYHMAQVAAYTSRYEGFGIPVIEAVLSGTPVVAATGSCLEEAGGSGAVYVNPDSVDEYVAAAVRLLDDRDECRRMVAEGGRRAERFSRDNMAGGIMASYQQALKAVGDK